MKSQEVPEAIQISPVLIPNTLSINERPDGGVRIDVRSNDVGGEGAIDNNMDCISILLVVYIVIVTIFQVLTSAISIVYLSSESYDCLVFSYKWQNIQKILIPSVIFDILSLVWCSYLFFKFYLKLFEAPDWFDRVVFFSGVICYIAYIYSVALMSDFLTSGILVSDVCSKSFRAYLISMTVLQWIVLSPMIVAIGCLMGSSS